MPPTSHEPSAARAYQGAVAIGLSEDAAHTGCEVDEGKRQEASSTEGRAQPDSVGRAQRWWRTLKGALALRHAADAENSVVDPTTGK
jgi:hypothetical protein